ncbi:DapH/DapD/GlmU-related protein [Rubrolithibacter danxiaensis]|uniref:DapH/DapD/GlmU-related protein n=1 Tax=Rubrolithibacter danxiaensis TaxID=3390805 RepID=UPI003BF9094D
MDFKGKEKGYKQFISSRFSSEWSKANIIITLLRLLPYILRGTIQRFFFASSKGLVMIGKGVSIRYASHLSAGRDFIIEDYAEVNCLASKKILIGNRVTIGKFAVIRPGNIYGGVIGEGLKIGNNSNIGPYSYIGCSGYIEIGDNVMMAPRVSIYAENHIFENTESTIKSQGVVKKFVRIEDDCWIAANSVIVAGVTIGKGSVIAAGSVVTRDVPPYSVVAGVPAVVVKNRK